MKVREMFAFRLEKFGCFPFRVGGVGGVVGWGGVGSALKSQLLVLLVHFGASKLLGLPVYGTGEKCSP